MGSKGIVRPRFQWCASNPVELQQNVAFGTPGTLGTADFSSQFAFDITATRNTTTARRTSSAIFHGL